MADKKNHLTKVYQSAVLAVLVLLAIYFGANILMPLVFSILVAVALTPLARKIESLGISRTLTAILIMVTGTLLFSGILFVLYKQAQSLLDTLPELSSKYDEWMGRLTLMIEEGLDISVRKQKELIQSNSEQLLNSNVVKSSFSTVMNFMSFMAVTPFYIAFLLIYRANVKAAIHLMSESSNFEAQGFEMVRRVESGLQQYLKGLLIVTTLIAILNGVGFLIIGLDYAILLAVLGALLTMIPYIGVFIGSLIPVTVALLTKDDIIYPIAVLAIAAFVQFLEGNFITPRIIGKSVGVNPAVIIFSVVLMGSLAGIIGMVLSAPLLAVFKIICENVDALKPIGVLIGGAQEKMEHEPEEHA